MSESLKSTHAGAVSRIAAAQPLFTFRSTVTGRPPYRPVGESIRTRLDEVPRSARIARIIHARSEWARMRPYALRSVGMPNLCKNHRYQSLVSVAPQLEDVSAVAPHRAQVDMRVSEPPPNSVPSCLTSVSRN